MPPEPTFTVTLTATEMSILVDALNAYADQEIDDPRNYTEEDLDELDRSQRAASDLADRLNQAAKSSL